MMTGNIDLDAIFQGENIEQLREPSEAEPFVDFTDASVLLAKAMKQPGRYIVRHSAYGYSNPEKIYIQSAIRDLLKNAILQHITSDHKPMALVCQQPPGPTMSAKEAHARTTVGWLGYLTNLAIEDSESLASVMHICHQLLKHRLPGSDKKSKLALRNGTAFLKGLENGVMACLKRVDGLLGHQHEVLRISKN